MGIKSLHKPEWERMYQDLVDMHNDQDDPGSRFQHLSILVATLDNHMRSNLDTALEWCLDHLSLGSWTWGAEQLNEFGDVSLVFSFASADDAALFRLTWV